MGTNTEAAPASTVCDLANDVKMKGYYRLAFALWKCGGGSMKSALDVLCQARGEECCTVEDSQQLAQLEDVIMQYIEKEMMEEDNMKRLMMENRTLAENATAVGHYEDAGIRGLLRAVHTRIRCELYPWDKHSLSSSSLTRQVRGIRRGLATTTPNCQIRAILESGKAPKLSLYATKDILSGHTVMAESNSMYVTTASGIDRFAFCHSCGARLIVSSKLLVNLVGDASFASEPINAKKGGCGSNTSNDSLDVDQYLVDPDMSRNTGVLSPEAREDKADISELVPRFSPVNAHRFPLTPPPHSGSSIYQNGQEVDEQDKRSFQICLACTDVVFCSTNCHLRAADDFHIYSCTMGLEELIKACVLPYEYRFVPQPEKQVLLNLMLLRVFTHCRNKRQHPLELDWMKMLDGNLDEARPLPNEVLITASPKAEYDDRTTADLLELFPELDSDPLSPPGSMDVEGSRIDSIFGNKRSRNNPTLIPWSYDNNVVRTIHSLYTMGGPELALDVKNFDGWVLNTLMAKIESGMRITKHPRMEKTFDEKGDLIRQTPFVLPGPGSDDSSNASTWNNEEVWVGSLHPVASLICHPGEGESANVTTFENDGSIDVVASPIADDESIRTSDTARKCGIRAGEILIQGDCVVHVEERDASSDGNPSLELHMYDSDSDVDMADTMAGAEITDDSQRTFEQDWRDKYEDEQMEDGEANGSDDDEVSD